MNQSEMTAKIEQGDGFIAALDQSGGSTPKALKGYGIEEGAWSSDEEMFGLIHQMRSRIITSPCFGSGKVIGAILFERTMDGTVDGKPTPQALIDQRRRAVHQDRQGPRGRGERRPADEADAGARRAARAREGARRVRHQGALGHQLGRTRRASPCSSRSSSRSRKQVLAHGLMPIIEPEVNIKSADRARERSICC